MSSTEYIFRTLRKMYFNRIHFLQFPSGKTQQAVASLRYKDCCGYVTSSAVASPQPCYCLASPLLLNLRFCFTATAVARDWSLRDCYDHHSGGVHSASLFQQYLRLYGVWTWGSAWVLVCACGCLCVCVWE